MEDKTQEMLLTHWILVHIWEWVISHDVKWLIKYDVKSFINDDVKALTITMCKDIYV